MFPGNKSEMLCYLTSLGNNSELEALVQVNIRKIKKLKGRTRKIEVII
jgi:hypothetical protein